jgi:prephenate dehydrogenase
MAFEKVTIVGVGLIGGSFALALKDRQLARKIIGVSRSAASAEKALSLQLVDQILPLEEAILQSDLIFISIPVDATIPIVKQLLDQISDKQIVLDAGSTKQALCQSIAAHPHRSRFVATHPMWGTEHSGPEAAVHGAFAGRSCVICEKEKSAPDALQAVEQLYKDLGMHLIYMDAQDHDVHTAYISHISHITSFALANTVLEKEKAEDAIFELAAAGFESTVRLAKSSPAMWAPIFMQNRENVLDVLNEHITQLKKFKACLEKENYDYLLELMKQANTIKKILK